MNESGKTAAEAYADRMQDIHILLDFLVNELDAHEQRQAADPQNWGFAGDVLHIRNVLKNALLFITAFGGDEIENAIRDVKE